MTSLPTLHMKPISSTYWEVTQDAHYQIEGVWFTVPKGFITNLDTVPRELGIFYAWFKNRTLTAAVLHDYMYGCGFYARDYCDHIFLKAMELEGVKKRYRVPIYWIVRLFGYKYFVEVI